MIVVLAAPSLADRSPQAERRRRRRSRSAGSPRPTRRSAPAARPPAPSAASAIRREQSFTRTLNGFSAVLDGRAHAELERTPGVVGVYPVRTVYPAALSAQALEQPGFEAGAGRRPEVALPRLRRRRRPHRAPRQRRRPRPSVLARPRAARARPGRRRQPRRRRAEAGRPGRARAARHAHGRASSSARAARPGSRASPRGDDPPDPHPRLAAGDRRRVRPPRRAATCCSPGSSAPSTRTGTATSPTRPRSRSPRSSSRSQPSPTAPRRAPSPAPRSSARSSSPRPGTTAGRVAASGRVGAPGGAARGADRGRRRSRASTLEADDARCRPATTRPSPERRACSARCRRTRLRSTASALARPLARRSAAGRRRDRRTAPCSQTSSTPTASAASPAAPRSSPPAAEDWHARRATRPPRAPPRSLVYGTRCPRARSTSTRARRFPSSRSRRTAGREALEALADGAPVIVSFGGVRGRRQRAAAGTSPPSPPEAGLRRPGEAGPRRARRRPRHRRRAAQTRTAPRATRPRPARAPPRRSSRAPLRSSTQARPGLDAGRAASLLVGSARQRARQRPPGGHRAGRRDRRRRRRGRRRARRRAGHARLRARQRRRLGRSRTTAKIRNLSDRTLESTSASPGIAGARRARLRRRARARDPAGRAGRPQVVARRPRARPLERRAGGSFVVARRGTRARSASPGPSASAPDAARRCVSAVEPLARGVRGRPTSHRPCSPSAPAASSNDAGGEAIEPVQLLDAELWRGGQAARRPRAAPRSPAGPLRARPHRPRPARPGPRPGAYTLRLVAHPPTGDGQRAPRRVDVSA